MSDCAILAYAVALPQLRLPASAYAAAWGGCAAAGLKQKAFCAYDEDPITLAVEAAHRAFERLRAKPVFNALYLGATTLPYEEKPATATLLTALTSDPGVRVVELRGSPQAGLQALVGAVEYCSAHSDAYALAVAADAPAAPPDAPYEHALGAAAAAFVVGPGTGVAMVEADTALSVETFGARFRRRGEAVIGDLELRTQDEGRIIADLVATGIGQDAQHLASGLPPRTGAAAAKRLGIRTADEIWPMLGDAGAASPAVALADVLDRASPGERVLAIAVGAGATALRLATLTGLVEFRRVGPTVGALLAGGRATDYLSYLRHRRMLSSRFGGTG